MAEGPTVSLQLQVGVNMRRFLAIFVLNSVLGISQANADRIERACTESDQNQTSSTLCNCIQEAANSKLTQADQRLAAKFFKKPDLAQKTRQSDDPRKQQFWSRYTSFILHATEICG